MTAPTKLQRWLDLIAFLVGRRIPVSVDELMAGIPAYADRWAEGTDTDRASIRRTFERDKDELRKLGIPIETVKYHINYGTEETEGYQLRKDNFYLPYLRLVGSQVPQPERPYRLQEVELTEAEAGSALEALQRVAELPASPLKREANSAFRKLAFDLDPDHFQTAPVLHLERPGSEEVRARLKPLGEAVRARKAVRFRYHGMYRGATTDRHVHPYGLFFQHGTWYLVAHDTGRDALRTFRVGRMEDVEPNRKAPGTPDFPVPPDFKLESYLQREAWELGDDAPLTARVSFRFPRSLWAERNRHGTLVEDRGEDGSLREFSVQQADPFLRWVLSMAGDARVESPPELQTEFRELAGQVAALYAGAR